MSLFFLAVTTFGLAGDSIVGAADIVLTTGSVNVCTSITLDSSMNAQINTTENQTHQTNT